MNVFGRVAKGVFGTSQAYDDHEDDSEVESLLHQISDSRHAGDRRDAMSQLRDLLHDNPSAQLAMGTMGLPVLLSVLQEDRDDLELLKGALEVLHLTVAMPEPAAGHKQQQQQLERSPPPALINADLFCRSPDNVLLLLGLLRDEPEGVDDFYVRYAAMQAMGGLLAACPDRLQACVLSSPLGVVALTDLLAHPMEVLRNEALLLLVGLCSGCPQIANIAAFEGGFEKLLGICASEGGPGGGDVVVQDAAELINNLLRDNLANQRLFREMGHINQLPQLLQFTPPPPPPASTAAGMLVDSASQYVDPSLRAAAGAAAAAAANTAVGAAAAAAVAAAGAAAGAAGIGGWPTQVAANYLCVLETARLLLALPHAANEEQRGQEEANRRANQDKLAQLGLLQLLAKLAADCGGAPSAAVRAQAMFCLGDLVHGQPKLQEQLAGTLAHLPPAAAAAAGLLPPPPQQQRVRQPPPALPLLQVALAFVVRGGDELERAGASHLLAAFCHDNVLGQNAVLSTVVASAEPFTFGEELCAALLCAQPTAAGSPSAPFLRPGGSSGPQGLPGFSSPPPSSLLNPAPIVNPLDLQLQAGRAATVLGFLLQQNPAGQNHMLGLQVGETTGDTLMLRCVRLLSEGARRADGRALPACYNILRLLITWCAGCSAAVSVLLAAPSHLPLLVDLVGARMAAGDVHTAGLAAVLLGVCLKNAPDSPMAQQQHAAANGPSAANGNLGPMKPAQPAAAAAPGSITFNQLLDVLLSRVGLSQFFGAIDDMRGSKSYQAAKAAPRLPAHITRSTAAAVLEAEAAEAAAAGSSGGDGASRSGGWGLLAGALTGGAAAGVGGSAGPLGVAKDAVQPYDHAFTQMVDEITSAVQQLTLNAFAGGTGPAAAAAGTLHVPGSSGAPWQQPQQQQGPPQLGPGQQLGAAAAAAAVGTGAAMQHQQHQQHQAGSLAALAAQLKGDNPEQKFESALHMIMQLQGSCAELQSRNRALAEDLIRLSQSKPHIAAADAAGAANSAAVSAGDAAAAAAAGQLGPPRPPEQNGHASSGGGSGPMSGGAGGQSLADVESRVAAQLRASRAEMEAGAMRQQLAAMQERWSDMEAQVAAAHEAAEEARAAAGKAEADLAALSTAYNGLEAHAFEVEEQLRLLQKQQASGAAAADAAGVSEDDVQARIRAAVEQDRQQRPVSAAPAAGDAAAGDVEARVAAAVAEAQAVAEAAAEEEMEDLLACLGEEQAKVEALSSRLAELGEDVDKLLEAVAAAQEEEGGEEADLL